MTDVAALIADMIRAGVDPDLIGRTAATIADAARPRYAATQERLRKLDVSVDEWETMRAVVFERDGFVCVYCGIDVSDAPQCDHIEPLSLGGVTHPSNLTTACKSCNSSKRDRPLHEWRRSS